MRLLWEGIMYLWNAAREGGRSLHTGDIGCVGQTASKLLDVKVEGLMKKSTASAITAKVCGSTLAWIWVGACQNYPENLTDGNFTAIWPTEPLPVGKDLNLLLKYVKSWRGWQQFKDRFCPLKVTSFTWDLFSNCL